MEGEFINGFSKLPKEEKLRFISDVMNDPDFPSEAASYWHPEKQEIFDAFSENTISNFYLPFGIAPNFLINNKVYHVPMVVEESSVVAAASAAAKFWSVRGGFQAKVISTIKKGHVHFVWLDDFNILKEAFGAIKIKLMDETSSLTANMRERGGGIIHIELEDFSQKLNNYYRIAVDFQTADSMGANFINSVLEAMAGAFRNFILGTFPEKADRLEIIMSILSNHVPDCRVDSYLSCPIEQLDTIDENFTGKEFANKFKTAVDIACIDPYRAATHNKGIMNGIDPVVIVTGNDFRAVEAGVHAWAASSGTYKSISQVNLDGNNFKFSLSMPLAIGTVGGLTSLHPMAKRAMQILGNPSASELMTIIASVGLASNFSAIRALITKGIQQGHMKMHLSNILLSFNLEPFQKAEIEAYFHEKKISHKAVQNYINEHFLNNAL